MSKKASTSRFGSNVTADVSRRKSAGSSYGYLKLPQGVNIFKESEGKLKLDIIPYMVTDEHHLDGDPKYPDAANPGNPWYKKPIYVHRSVGAENQSVICPKTFGKKCPICEHRAQQQSKGVEKDDLISKPQLRNLYVVIPIGHKEYEEKFHIWDIANGNFQEKLDEELNEGALDGSFLEPETGKTLLVRFSEEVFNKNKFFKASRIDAESRDGYDEKIMSQAPNLDEIISCPTYKELEKMFLELEEEEEEPAPKVSMKKTTKVVEPEEEEEEEAPARKKKTVEDAHPFKKKKVVEPEPEEEEEEEEEEPVAKKTIVKKKTVVVEEEEEEEEEEKPTTPLRKKKVEPEPVEEEEEDDEPAPPVRKAKTPSSNGKSAPATNGATCPAGYKFGVDWDGYDNCDDCAVFKACGQAHEKK